MTIARVYAPGFTLGMKLTSAHANGLDLNGTYALDKRSGQTDTLESIVTCASGGRIVTSYAAGANADTTYVRASAAGTLDASAGLTAARAYTLSNTGAQPGDRWFVLGNATYDVTVKNAAASTLLVLGAGSTAQSRWAEFLFNGSAWVLMRSSYAPQRTLTTFTANGNYTVPADCYMLLVLGCGGGGGGGGAAGGGSSTSVSCAGGGGGGAAFLGSTFVSTTPGTVFAVTIGSGGAGGAGIAGASAGGTENTNGGADGGDTTFGSTLTFKGAQGGSPAYTPVSTSGNIFQFVPGGGPTKGGPKARASNTAATTDPASVLGVRMPGEGGYGSSRAGGFGSGASAGNPPHVMSTLAGSGTTTPGTAGADGTASGSYQPGGGGGGGGASAVGSGGNGGAGANGNGAGVGANGTAGSSAAANTGAGGGGGGGAGFGTVVGGIGGAGGAGGSGVLIVIPIR